VELSLSVIEILARWGLLDAYGVPDLIIAQNAIQNNLPVYSIDKHFGFMRDAKFGLKLYT